MRSAGLSDFAHSAATQVLCKFYVNDPTPFTVSLEDNFRKACLKLSFVNRETHIDMFDRKSGRENPS
jgi:hypothetical protein